MTTQEFDIAVTAFVLAYRSGDGAQLRMDNGYDEWLEENLDRFGSDEEEVAFAQWKSGDGRKPRDCSEPSEVERLWDEYSRSREDAIDDDWFAENLGDIDLEDLMEDIDLEEEEGRWVTTENGHKVHINDKGVPDKGNPFVLGAMKRKAPVTDVSKRTKSDFMPEGSYQESPDFQKTLKEANEARDKKDALYDRIKEVEDELKTESRPKPKGEWGEEDEYQRLLGKKPMIYTDRGRQLAEEKDRLWDEHHKAGKDEDRAGEVLQEIKKEARKRELEDYHPEPLHRAASDEYEGFTLGKTSNSFGDDHLANGEGVICEMSPREYLERCAFEIFENGTMESCLNGINEKSAREYAKQMKEGMKFHLPYLNYKGSGQEGRHRALAAYFAGIETIPVLVIGRSVRKDAEDEGRWVTTDNGHRVHINDKGVPDKGNPEVIEKMAGGSAGTPAPDKESRLRQLESEMENAKGLMAKSKIRTQIEMLKADWQGTKEEWLAHKKQMQEEASKKSMERQAREKAEKEAKAQRERIQLEMEMRTQPKEKVAQYKIIQEHNPMLDDYHVGIRKPSDIKTWDEILAEDDGDSFDWGDFSKADAEKAQKAGKVKVYSSYPIGQGVFVSTSRIQAEQYTGGKGGKVYSRTIPLSKVAWINGDEGQFADTDSKRTDEDDWVTIKGTHVLIDEEGVAQSGGKLKGKKFQNAKSQKRTAQKKAEGASPFDNEDFLKAAGKADNEVEFWFNLTPEQQQMVGKDYKKVYSQLKAKAGDTKPEWVPTRGKVSDMPTKMEDPGRPVSVEIKEPKGTHTASAEGYNVVNLYKGHEHEWNDEVYIHELGHQLSNFGLGTDILQNPGGLWGRYNQKQMVFYGPDAELALSPEESFADCFRDYMVRPDHLKKKSKDVYDYFQRMEKDNPWVRDYVKRSLEEIRRAVNEHMHKDSDDGRWVTTENNHKVHINDKGVPDKGNPHVLDKMSGDDPDEFDPFAELMKAAGEGESPKPEKNAKPEERRAVTGKDISGSYEGDGDIKSVMHAQGFDGLPQVVSDEEFDEAVKKSGMAAKRAYSASSQEVLDAYRDSLYNGDWYVECEGGSLFGQGMYTVSDYTGKGKEEVESEISIYSKRNSTLDPYHVVEDITLAPDAKIIDRRDLKDEWFGRFDPKKTDYEKGVVGDGLRDIEEEYGRDAATYARYLCSDPSVKEDDANRAGHAIGQDMMDMLDDLSYDIMDRYESQLDGRSKKIRAKYKDINAYAAALGYDAVRCGIDKEHATYTVILNRTKAIIRDGRGRRDGAETEAITFRPGKKGRIEAVRDGRVVGWVMTGDYQSSTAPRQDEEPAGWITLENGEHVPLNKAGEAIGGAGGWAKGKAFSTARTEPPRYGKAAGKPPETKGAFTTKQQYKPGASFQEWQKANMIGRDNPTRKALSAIFDKEGMEGVEKEYYSSRTLEASKGMHQVSTDEAEHIMFEAMPKNVFHGWFMEANSDYKPRVVNAVTSSPQARSAALSLMYENYKNEAGGDLSFEEFLTTPITMYRGGHGQKHTESDVFSSYSLRRDAAQKFAGGNGTVYEAKIRPIDTWGSVLTNGESEVMVPHWIAPNGHMDSADGRGKSTPGRGLRSRNKLFSQFWMCGNRYISEKIMGIESKGVVRLMCRNGDFGER